MLSERRMLIRFFFFAKSDMKVKFFAEFSGARGSLKIEQKFLDILV